MTWRRRGAAHRGATRLGCLISLLILVTVAYYSVNAGTVYFKYWRLKEEIRSQARLAPSLDDQTIHRRILRKVEQLDLPPEARKITIRRSTRPREIWIQITYRETLELPFFRYTVTLSPEARQPL